MNNKGRQISGERKALYYVGLAITILGFLIFFSIFISTALTMGSFGSGPGPMSNIGNGFGSFALRGVLGMGMMIFGAALMNVGSRGLAGSGVKLDPQQARRDLEPWARMAGGMAQDALDEANIDLSRGSSQRGDLPFDEKLRRLEKLRSEGLLTQAEYEQKRQEILNEDW